MIRVKFWRGLKRLSPNLYEMSVRARCWLSARWYRAKCRIFGPFRNLFARITAQRKAFNPITWRYRGRRFQAIIHYKGMFDSEKPYWWHVSRVVGDMWNHNGGNFGYADDYQTAKKDSLAKLKELDGSRGKNP